MCQYICPRIAWCTEYASLRACYFLTLSNFQTSDHRCRLNSMNESMQAEMAFEELWEQMLCVMLTLDCGEWLQQ